jgi:hypothetical protein
MRAEGLEKVKGFCTNIRGNMLHPKKKKKGKCERKRKKEEK